MTTHALTTAAAKPQLEPTNLRPLNVRRDLGEVADLIYDAFADELDTSGLSALREMRAFGHMGPFTLLLSHFNPDFHDMLAGFCLLYTSPSPRDRTRSRMPSSA